MDYDNNAKGRAIGAQYRKDLGLLYYVTPSDYQRAQLSKRVRTAVNTGQLKRLVRPVGAPQTDCTQTVHAASCKFYYTTGSCNSWVNFKKQRKLI